MVTYCLTSLGKGWQAKEKALTQGWGLTWEILGSDRACHRRNLGKYCYIHGELLSSSICHSDFEDHLIWPWSIYISCIQNQASEMQIRRGSWTVLCRKPVECVIPETVLDAWSALHHHNSNKFFAMMGTVAFNQDYNGTDPFFSLSWPETQLYVLQCAKYAFMFWQSQPTFQDDTRIFTMLLSSCFFII